MITDRQATKVAFQPLLSNILPTPWDIAFVVFMPKGGMLPVHDDGNMRGWTRHVLALQTNPMCACYHDGGWQHLEEGGLYRMDATKPHGSVNLGDRARIHLSVDIRL